MNFDEIQALDSSNYDESDEEQEFERNRKLVGHLKVFKQLDLEEKVYKIYEGENFIGRDEGSDVYIPRKSLSKSHACIEVSDSLHLIYDNSSKNKTRRDKVALKPQVRYELKTGDMLTVADLRLQYFIGDVPQLDDDNDDTGSETGSESMLPIDATTTDVTTNEAKDNVSKVYAADTDSDTDDEKPIKQQPSDKPKVQKDDNQESKPQVPKVMYDSYDEDEEIITKKPHDVIPHKGEDSALDVSSEGGTLAFGLVSPTDERPFIRPTPKQAVKETPATLLYTQNEATSSQKDGVPSTLLYASQTQDGSTRNLSPKSSNKQIENAPATLLYSTQTQDKSLASETSDVSPEKPLGNTPATLLYSAQTQDRSLASATSDFPPEKALVDTPATLLYNTDIQDNVDSNSKSHESSSSSAEIFEPETQGFSPKETSFCLPTQSYIKETPADTEEKGLQISNIPESDDEEDKDGVKRNLSFDESATQAYTWNDSDATDDEDDDLRFQPTQAYPANMKSTENNEDTTDDEQSNPDLYATTKPTEDAVAESSDEEKQEIKEISVEPTMPYGIDDMETQAYEVEDKDVLTRMGDSESTDVKNGKQRAHDHSETADSDKMNKGPKGHRKGRVQFTKDLQPTLPYSMQETQAYEADENIIEEETDKDFEKPSVSDNKVTQNVDNMMETQAYDAFEETASNLQPTLPYSMMETQAYDADEDITEGEKMFKKPIVKGGKVTEVVEQTFPYSMTETQAYDAETEEDSPDKHQHKTSTETANLPVVVEPTLPYDVTDTDDLERGIAEDAVIQETQAYGVGDDSETDDETLDSNAAGPSGIHESEKEKIESKESEAIQDTYEATQAYGLDSHVNEVVPDSEDVSSKGIPTPKATKSKSDKNNNTTNNMSDNQETPQEVCEIIIRPIRRGRGRVTQGDDDHPVATKVVDVIPKSSRGRRSRKSTKEDTTLENDVKTVKARKSARNEDKSLDNEDMTTRSVAKSPQSRRSARKEEKSPENEDLSTHVTKVSKSRRSARKDEKPLDKEDMAASVPEAPKSRRSARKEDKPLDKEDMADSVPEAPKSRRSARKENKPIDNEDMADSVTKAPKSRRSARKEDKPLDNEDMAESVPEAPKSRRSARKEDKHLDNEDMADSVAKAPKSRRSARKEDKPLDNEDMADNVTKAPKSRRSARKEDKPLENEDMTDNVPEAPMLSQGTRRASGRTRKTAVKTNQDSPKPQLKERAPKTEEEKTHKSEKGKSQEEYADSLEMKDSEEEFMFKGKGKGKRKGKQPAKKHLQVADDDLSEKDSEDLPPLDAILSEKKQEKDQFKKEVKEEQVSSSPGSTPRRKRGKTKTDDETPSKKQKEDNDDTPKQRSSIRERRQPMPRIMFTGVIDKEAEKIVTSLGGTMEESIHNCTHLITDKVRRTVKFLCGLASGCIIALPTWLTASKKSKKFIDHEPYFVQDKAAEKMYSFSLQLSHEQALKKGLLEGYKVHVTKNVKPEPQQMKDIIQCAKGEFLTRMPRTKEDNILVISCDADHDACKPALASGIPVYSAELLLTGILRQDFSLDQNLLFVENEGKTSGSTTRKRRNESSVSESSQSSSRSSKRKKK